MVSEACIQQLSYGLLVLRIAGALIDDRTVPFEAVPLQRGKDQVTGTRLFPRRVNVLHAHQPTTVVAAGLKATCHGGKQGTEMQRSGGRRGESPHVARVTDSDRLDHGTVVPPVRGAPGLRGSVLRPAAPQGASTRLLRPFHHKNRSCRRRSA